MADVEWEVRIKGKGPAKNSDPDDADEILKIAYDALKTAGHTNLRGFFEVKDRTGFETPP